MQNASNSLVKNNVEENKVRGYKTFLHVRTFVYKQLGLNVRPQNFL